MVIQAVSERIKWSHVLDGLWLVGLALYMLAGLKSVPFHGDESTLIYMSRDYAYLVQQHDLDRVLYSETNVNPLEQHLRLLNGTVCKMTIGLAWDIAGMDIDDLNRPWDWANDWDANVFVGSLPSDRLLHTARLPSALLAALSVWGVFGIARVAAGSRPAAWIASLIYVTHPAVLLNGRRAMMEGSQLAFSALVVLAGLLWARAQARNAPNKVLNGWAITLGAAVGLAAASKHNTTLTSAAIFIALYWPQGWGQPRTKIHRRRLIGAALVAAFVFLALNPAWWSNPFGTPWRVMDERATLLDIQVANYGGYDGPREGLEGLVNEAFFRGPQYYEVDEWGGFVGDQITTYEDWRAGRRGGPVWGALLIAACTAGLIYLGRRWRTPEAWTTLVWLGVTAVGLLILTPLPWQRYYLPLVAPLAVVAGTGIDAAARRVWERLGRGRIQEQQISG